MMRLRNIKENKKYQASTINWLVRWQYANEKKNKMLKLAKPKTHFANIPV